MTKLVNFLLSYLICGSTAMYSTSSTSRHKTFWRKEVFVRIFVSWCLIMKIAKKFLPHKNSCFTNYCTIHVPDATSGICMVTVPFPCPSPSFLSSLFFFSLSFPSYVTSILILLLTLLFIFLFSPSYLHSSFPSTFSFSSSSSPPPLPLLLFLLLLLLLSSIPYFRKQCGLRI